MSNFTDKVAAFREDLIKNNHLDVDYLKYAIAQTTTHKFLTVKELDELITIYQTLISELDQGA